MQKLYCYVDESGQDAGSEFFVVVAVISSGDQEMIRAQLLQAEEVAQTKHLKWHKTAHLRRIQYLSFVMEKHIARGNVYAAHYQKPIPYFFPMLEVLKQAIQSTAQKSYLANVYVDGIDRYKAKQLTNALRISGISLRIVKSKRDESEPIIRLADMWAGCIRSALLKHQDTQELLNRAKHAGYLRDINN